MLLAKSERLTSYIMLTSVDHSFILVSPGILPTVTETQTPVITFQLCTTLSSVYVCVLQGQG